MRCRTTALAIFQLMIMIGGRAPASGADLSIERLADKLRPQTTEVPGDMWGWDLINYPNVVGQFFLHHRSLLILASGTQHILLFDPVSGKALRINSSQADTLIKGSAARRPAPGKVSFEILPGLQAKNIPSPGNTFSCHPPFFEYASIKDNVRRLSSDIYVVHRFSSPRKIFAETCSPAGVRTQTIISTVDEAGTMFIALPDRSILLQTISPPALIRLDDLSKAKSSLGGRLYVINADPVNTALEKDQRYNDISYRLYLDKRIKVFENHTPK